MVDCNAVCIRRAAETDANFGALHYANSVGSTGRCCWAASVVATLIMLSFNTAKDVLLVSNKAVSTLAFIRVLPGNTDAVWPALVEPACIKAPLATSVVSSAHISEPPAVFVNLAFIFWPAPIDRVVGVSLVILQAVARRPVVVHTAYGVGTALLSFAGIDALSTMGTHLVRGTLVI